MTKLLEMIADIVVRVLSGVFVTYISKKINKNDKKDDI